MLKSIEIPFGDGWATLVGNYTPAEPDGSCGWEFEPWNFFVENVDLVDEISTLYTSDGNSCLEGLIKRHQDKICSDE